MCWRPNAVGAVTMSRPEALFAPAVSASSARAQLVEQAVAILVEGRCPSGVSVTLRVERLKSFTPEALLELVDAPADHRRRDAFLARGRREAAALGNLDESGQLLEAVHGHV